MKHGSYQAALGAGRCYGSRITPARLRAARARALTFALTDSDVCVTMTEGPAPLWTSKGVCLHRTLLTTFLNSVSNSGRT